MPYIVTDAYPDEGVTANDGTVPVRLLNLSTDTEQAIARIFLSKTQGEFRIDAHPSWDRSGRYLVFNGFIDSTLTVFLADLKGKLEEATKTNLTDK